MSHSVKNSIFGLCPEALWEAELENSGLINLVTLKMFCVALFLLTPLS